MSASSDPKLVETEDALMRQLWRLTVYGWWPHAAPLAAMTISPGFRIVPHGTGRYHYTDGEKPGNLRYRDNISNELVKTLLLRCTRRAG